MGWQVVRNAESGGRRGGVIKTNEPSRSSTPPKLSQSSDNKECMCISTVSPGRKFKKEAEIECVQM